MTTESRFAPSTDTKKFRIALGRFATGITVITTITPQGPIGITANSFASISLEPALVMWSPAKASSRHDIFVAADAFAVHVLSSDQKAVCDAFIRRKDAFEEIAYTPNQDGVPLIAGCLAVFECRRSTTYSAGDHTIILGEVYAAFERAGDSLIFSNGEFSSLQQTASAA